MIRIINMCNLEIEKIPHGKRTIAKSLSTNARFLWYAAERCQNGRNRKHTELQRTLFEFNQVLILLS